MGFRRSIIVLFVILVFIIPGCIETTGKPKVVPKTATVTKTVVLYDAIAVWQNDLNGDWDIYYSLWNYDRRQWLNFENMQSSAIIKRLPGKDLDPDIASIINPNPALRSKAISVWSHETAGDYDIYYSVFLTGEGSRRWGEPEPIAVLDGDDLDPTIAMKNSEEALVVWVNDRNGLRELYYSIYSNGVWSQPNRVYDGLEGVVMAKEASLPQLTFNPKGGFYVLGFTGKVEEGKMGKLWETSKAFAGTYSEKGWFVEVILNQPEKAVFNSGNPTDERIGAASNVAGESTIVWPTENGELYYAIVNTEMDESNVPEAYSYAEGKMPDVGYDSSNFPTSLYTHNDKIETLFGISRPEPEKRLLKPLDTKEEDNRNALTFVRDRSTGLSVWWSNTDTPSEIYYSFTDNNWEMPRRLEPNMLRGRDRNPEVTPLTEVITKEVEEEEGGIVVVEGFCPDGVLDPGEECEIGIPCANPDDVCDIFAVLPPFDCKCLPPGDITPEPGGPQPPTPEPQPPEIEEEAEAIYGGAACGFNEVRLRGFLGPEYEGVHLRFLPDTTPSNGLVAFSGPYAAYEANMRLFPLSEPPHPEYNVYVNFKENDTIIEMMGVDDATGFIVCTGTFEKGKAPGSLEMIPAEP